MFPSQYSLFLLIGLTSSFCAGSSSQATKSLPETVAVSNVDADQSFEVVTIKPSELGASSGKYFRRSGRHLLAANVDLLDLITLAYSLHPKQVVNGPKWMDTAKYDIDGVPNSEERPTVDQQRAMYRSLLADRFHLLTHFEQREMPVYSLELDKGGSRLPQTTRQPADPTNFSYTNQIVLTVRNASMKTFADGMQASFLDRPVIDRTNLTGRYDFILKWTPDDSSAKDTSDAPPDLYSAIKEQLGLKIVPEKAAVKALVIDHVDPPAAN